RSRFSQNPTKQIHDHMNIDEIIRAVQERLGVEADGKAGPETWEAIYNRIVPRKATAKATAAVIQTVDERSEKTIATLLPQVQPYARALVLKAAKSGITIKVISGLRAYRSEEHTSELQSR